MTEHSNPPAFPQTFYDEKGHFIDGFEGMSLLDHFAGLAMQAAYAHLSGEADHTKHWTEEGIAESAYEMADAMLKERAKWIK